MSVDEAKRLLDLGLKLSNGRIFLPGKQEVFTTVLADLSLEVSAGNTTLEIAKQKIRAIIPTMTLAVIKGGKT